MPTSRSKRYTIFCSTLYISPHLSHSQFMQTLPWTGHLIRYSRAQRVWSEFIFSSLKIKLCSLKNTWSIFTSLNFQSKGFKGSQVQSLKHYLWDSQWLLGPYPDDQPEEVTGRIIWAYGHTITCIHIINT